jgi:hypothetical protein
MTTAGVPSSAPVAGRQPARPARPARPALIMLRLPWLYLVSRRVPAALGLIAGLAVLLWASLRWHWNVAGGPAAQEFIPLAIEAGTAAVVAVTTYGPFGEPERAAGRWLPYLRLGAALALTAAAFGALAAAAAAGATGATGATGAAAGAAAGGLAGGTLAMLRNLAGIVGTGLLTAAAAGGAFGWVGPMAYLLVTEVALTGTTTTPWVWPAHPAHDRGAAICASLVYAAGVVVITVRGTRNSGRDPHAE